MREGMHMMPLRTARRADQSAAQLLRPHEGPKAAGLTASQPTRLR